MGRALPRWSTSSTEGAVLSSGSIGWYCTSPVENPIRGPHWDPHSAWSSRGRRTSMSHPRYSIVVPVHNEEPTLPHLHCRLAGLLDRLDGEGEVLLVDDGSRDR